MLGAHVPAESDPEDESSREFDRSDVDLGFTKVNGSMTINPKKWKYSRRISMMW